MYSVPKRPKQAPYAPLAVQHSLTYKLRAQSLKTREHECRESIEYVSEGHINSLGTLYKTYYQLLAIRSFSS